MKDSCQTGWREWASPQRRDDWIHRGDPDTVFDQRGSPRAGAGDAMLVEEQRTLSGAHPFTYWWTDLNSTGHKQRCSLWGLSWRFAAIFPLNLSCRVKTGLKNPTWVRVFGTDPISQRMRLFPEFLPPTNIWHPATWPNIHAGWADQRSASGHRGTQTRPDPPHWPPTRANISYPNLCRTQACQDSWCSCKPKYTP